MPGVTTAADEPDPERDPRAIAKRCHRRLMVPREIPQREETQNESRHEAHYAMRTRVKPARAAKTFAGDGRGMSGGSRRVSGFSMPCPGGPRTPRAG